MVKLSLICPCYKSRQYLPRLFSSYAKLENKEEVELILVIDPSKDDGREIIEKATREDPSIKTIFNENRLGLMKSRLLGIQKSNSDYIGFVDADDWLEPNFAKEMTKALEENDADIVDCSFYLNKDNKEITYHYHMSNKLMDRSKAIKALLNDIGIRGYLWNKVFRKSLFDKGPFIVFEKGHGFEDMPFVFSLFDKVNKVYSLNLPLYHYNIAPHQSLTHDNKDRAKEHVESYLSLKAYAQANKDKQLLSLLRKAYPRMRGMLFYDFCLCKNEGLTKEDKKEIINNLKLIKSKEELNLNDPKFKSIFDALSFVISS